LGFNPDGTSYGFFGNSATRWGNVLEDVTRDMAKVIYKCNIYEIGSIQNKLVKGHKYSPDGLGILEVEMDGITKYIVILFEFKTPSSRSELKYFIQQYSCQLHSGMSTIDIISKGVLLCSMIRSCKLIDYSFSNFNYIKNGSYDKYEATKVQALTYIGVYTTTQPVCHDLVPDVEGIEEIICDEEFLVEEIQDVDDCFSKIMDGEYKKYVADIILPSSESSESSESARSSEFDQKKYISKFVKYCEDNKYYIIGIVPLKILDTVIHEVKKTQEVIDFIPSRKDTLNKISDILTVAKDKTSIQEKIDYVTLEVNSWLKS
jgi:hypothetical protein